MKILRNEELRDFFPFLLNMVTSRVICVQGTMDDFTFYLKTSGERSHVDEDTGRRIILIHTLK
jgi:hypothetical protein